MLVIALARAHSTKCHLAACCCSAKLKLAARVLLQVFCGTWNVGNAKPSTNLSSWLRGVEQGEHDIVAIGVQECSYK